MNGLGADFGSQLKEWYKTIVFTNRQTSPIRKLFSAEVTITLKADDCKDLITEKFILSKIFFEEENAKTRLDREFIEDILIRNGISSKEKLSKVTIFKIESLEVFKEERITSVTENSAFPNQSGVEEKFIYTPFVFPDILER